MDDKNVARRSFFQKCKEEPFVPLGLLGTVGMIAFGVKDYKNRGTMPTSMYIMKYRVVAQSVIVGAITVGITYNLAKEYLLNPKEK